MIKQGLVILKIISSIFVVNRDSHDSSFEHSIGDCRAFWQDVQCLEKLFYCENCNKLISKKYYNNFEKKIRCKCGNISYDWKN